MRRILPTALATALVVGSFAGVASARFATDAQPPRELAPMRAPAAMPAEDVDHDRTYGFRSAAAIARGMQATEAASAPATAGGASASITVTATVLPVVTIVVDEEGDVVELVANTPDRSARAVLFAVRSGSSSGALEELDAATWTQARAALASAEPGTGTIWRG